MAVLVGERYRLERRLARGGMAEVYVATDVRLGRRVALKVLRTDLPDPQARRRFEREARVLAGFDHPDAVTLYDVGEHGSRPFLVMEFVDGRDLAQHLADVGRLDLAEALAVVRPVLRALGAAHERGIVHRDVKPANILLGADGRVRLADFGIARMLADAAAGLTMAGQVIGTPRYLAPEQLTGGAATARSDVYAAAVVLYEALAGDAPRPDDTVLAAAAAAVELPVASLTARRHDVPAALADVVARAMARDPAARPADASGFLRELGEAMARPASTAPTGVTAAVAAGSERPRLDATQVLPVVPGPFPATSAGAAPAVARRSPRRASAAPAVFVGIGALALAATMIALTRSRADDPAAPTTPAPATSPATSPAPVTAAPTAAPTTRQVAATTVPATTARPGTTLVATTLRPTTTVASTTVGPTTTMRATTTVRPTTTGPVVVLPATLDGLVTLLAAEPAAYGTDGPELLNSLRTVQRTDPRRRNGRDRAAAVERALADIDRWLADGTIDRPMGEQARTVLGSLPT